MGQFSSTDVITISKHLNTPRINAFLNAAPLKDLSVPDPKGPQAADAGGRSAQVFLVEVVVRRGNEERRVAARGRDIYAFTAPIVVEAAEQILLVHCGIGRDRTGLIVMVLLALGGVRPEDIAADYELSTDRLPALFAAQGVEDQTELIREILARKNTTVREALFSALEGMDVEAHLRGAGLNDEEVMALRERLVHSGG